MTTADSSAAYTSAGWCKELVSALASEHIGIRTPDALMREEFGHYKDDPVSFVREILQAEPYGFQAKILEAMVREPRIAVRSGNGPGKTCLAAWAVLWFLATRVPSRVPCTSVSERQLSSGLWPEISKWLGRSRRLSAYLEWTATRIKARWAPERHHAILRAARTPESISGIHETDPDGNASPMLIVCDEASGILDPIWEAIDGLLATGAHLLMISNPVRTSGRFYDAFHRDRAKWWTYHIRHTDSPRIQPDWIEEMKSKYGEDSDIFRVRVLGEFPSGEEDVFIPLALAEAALDNELPEEDVACVVGVDPAGWGDDQNAVVIRKGDIIVEAWTRSKIPQQELVGEVSRVLERHRCVAVNIDRSGEGRGPWELMLEAQEDPNTPYHHVAVNGVAFGSSPSDDTLFSCYADEMWSAVKERLTAGRLDLTRIDRRVAEEIVGQLSTRKAKVWGKHGALKLESKDEMRRRGIRSPDLADALALACIEDHTHAPLAAEGNRETYDIAPSETRIASTADW